MAKLLVYKALPGPIGGQEEPKKQVSFSKASLRNVSRHNKCPSVPKVRDRDKLRSVMADQIIASDFDPECMKELSDERERDARRKAYDLHKNLYPKDYWGTPAFSKRLEEHPFFVIGQKLIWDSEDVSDSPARETWSKVICMHTLWNNPK